MKLLIVVGSLLFVGCSSIDTTSSIQSDTQKNSIKIYENNEIGVESIITNRALKSFKEEYASAPKNRAFAQSESGAWNWKSDRTSKDHAITSALIGCQRNNKKSEDLYPCKVIHVNDQWVK